MAVIDTGLTEKGLRNEFFARFDAMKGIHFQDLATRIESKSDAEKYAFLGSIPVMREWGTGRLARGIRSESYNVENLKYESTIEVDRDEISDDQTGQIRMRIGELAARAALHKDYLIAQLLMSGATAGFNSYDGVTFFNDAHVSGDSGNQDNDLEADASDADAPSVGEFKAAMQGAIAAMMAFKDDQGQPMMLTTDGLVAVVPPTMFFTALEALSATLVNTTSNVLAGAAKVISFPWLTDLSQWYLLNTGQAIRPFIFQDREPVEFGALEEKSDGGFMREVFIYGVRARYRMAYGYWQYAVRTDFTT